MSAPSNAPSTAPTTRHTIAPAVRLTHPEWSRDAAIYQVNTRQFTDEGTLAAATERLPEVAGLGVRIVWLMPVNPIGEKNRKGVLGSPYAIRDYRAVNPELGTLADLQRFVARAHELGLKVIIDWVANHSSWDNPLVTEHPDWYVRDWREEFMPTPWWDWHDVIDFDYSVPELRDWMADSMAYWVREADIDGFRCDVAGFVPTDFWEQVRTELEQIKPVFMLAEWEARDLHVAAFDMTYGWSWNEALHNIAQGKADVNALRAYYAWNAKAYPRDIMRMMFVSNHDKNSWEGTEYEMFGDALEAAIVLSVVGEGMPLIYNGQEAGNDKRLEFFDRDPIVWRDHPMREFYTRLVQLKKEHPVLHNAAWGAPMVNVPNTDPDHVLTFTRERQDDGGIERLFAAFNFSDQERTFTIQDAPHEGTYTDWQTGADVRLDATHEVTLPAWGWQVLLLARSG